MRYLTMNIFSINNYVLLHIYTYMYYASLISYIEKLNQTRCYT